MPQGVRFTVNENEFEVLSEYRGVESAPWDRGNHPAFDIYMRVNGSEFAKFDYYGSIHDFHEGKEELQDWEHCSVAQMIMSDAATGYEDFEDMCSNLGYEDNKESRAIYRGCVESYDKFDQVLRLRGDDLIDTYNAMIDFENEESRYETLEKESIEIDDIEAGEFEVSRVESFDWSKVDWWDGDNENLTEQAVRRKYEEMKEPIQNRREAFKDLENILDDIGEYDVEVELEDWENRNEIGFENYLTSEMPEERGVEYLDKYNELHVAFFDALKNSVGATEASEELIASFNALKEHSEKGIGYIESSVGVNFEEHEFDDSMSSVVDGYFPMMNAAWRTDNCPSESIVEDILENAPNVSIVNVGDETYIAMNGAGFDMSNSIAYAYLKIDREIPKELGVCRQRMSGTEKAFEEVKKYLDNRDIKEIASKGQGKTLSDALGSLNGSKKNLELK